MKPDRFYTQSIETPLGPFESLWTKNGLWAFCFQAAPVGERRVAPGTSLSPEFSPQGSANPFALEQSVREYFETGEFSWDVESLDWQGVSAFHRRVLRACYRIPAGSVLTYGELASKVGSPKAARAVGAAMAANRWPLLIPCHRVVGSGGKLTGYSGIGGLETKRRLLEMEAAKCELSEQSS